MSLRFRSVSQAKAYVTAFVIAPLGNAESAPFAQPWVVAYQSPPKRDGQLPAPTRFQTADANGEIKIRNPRAGTYRLLSVRDKYCPGDVAETEWNVATLPRPTLRIADGVGKVARNGSVIRAGVCANAVDSVPVLFQGPLSFASTCRGRL